MISCTIFPLFIPLETTLFGRFKFSSNCKHADTPCSSDFIVGILYFGNIFIKSLYVNTRSLYHQSQPLIHIHDHLH